VPDGSGGDHVTLEAEGAKATEASRHALRLRPMIQSAERRGKTA
jgi:hypothetical protein